VVIPSPGENLVVLLGDDTTGHAQHPDLYGTGRQRKILPNYEQATPPHFVSSPEKLFPAGDYLAPRYWLLWLGFGLMWLVARLPFRVQMATGAALGWCMYLLVPSRRHIAEVNLQLCFPELSDEARKKLLRRHFNSLGKASIETAMAWWASDAHLKRLHRVEGLEHLDAALAHGNGVILVSGHFTTLEIGGRMLALHRPFAVMYREHKNPLYEHIMRHHRKVHFKDAIPRTDVRRALRTLKDNQPLWYAPDQDYGRKHSVFAPFFGVQAAMITATARFAKMSGARVVPYFQERLADGSGYVMRLYPALENFPVGDDVIDATTINSVIENEIRKYPEQYLWVHRRFKTRPEGEARPYLRK
jgi:KDO2-lipid IV(A) lauroyltransferase